MQYGIAATRKDLVHMRMDYVSAGADWGVLLIMCIEIVVKAGESGPSTISQVGTEFTHNLRTPTLFLFRRCTGV